MARAWLLVACLAVLTSGCLDGGLNGLIGQQERLEEARLGDLEATFTYQNVLDPEAPPAGPDDAADRGQTTFQVPPSSQDLQVSYKVTFDNPTGQAQDDAQRVVLRLMGPDGVNRSATETSSGQGAWFFDAPAPGQWTLAYEARGEGSISAIVTAQVPAGA